MIPVLAWTLVEVIALILIVTLIAGILVALLVRGGKKITDYTVQQLVKAECASSSKKSGEFDINLGVISQGTLDKITQGFSIEVFGAKVIWKRRGNRCIYKIEVTATDNDGNTVKRSSGWYRVKI